MLKLLLSVGVLAVSCVPPVAPKATQSLRMQGGPPDATVIIDDEVIGPLDYVMAHGVALPKGEHYVTVKATGYFPSDTVVEAQPPEREGDMVPPIVLDVKLVPVPD